jgi:hypothetical protein
MATWGAVAAAAIVVLGVGGAALRAGDDSGNNSAPATTRVATSTPTNAPPTTVPTTEPVSSNDAAFDRAVTYLGGLAVAQDPSCRLSAANPALGEAGALEEVGVDCTLTAASGASVDFRSVVLRPGVTVQQYLDGLAAAPGLQVVGGSLPSDPDGPYLDIGGRLPDGRTYSCRSWGQAPVAADTNAIAIACSASMADVVDFWRLHR